MNHQYVLTMVGKDQPGIVAAVTGVLFAAGCNLGEAGMQQLGKNFSMMLIVETNESQAQLKQSLGAVIDEFVLALHIDVAEPLSHEHMIPDVRVTVHGADRSGIVAQVTQAAAAAGLNIIDLISDVGGTGDAPIYILHIEGVAANGIEKLEQALTLVQAEGIKVDVRPVETMLG